MAHEEILEAVRALAPSLRERSAEGEELRRLPDTTVKELRDTGMIRLLQPRRYGGHEADPRLFFECLLSISAACGSTGWVSGVVGVHPWQIAHWDDRVQQEIWGDDADTWVSSSYMPGGKLRPVDGGFRLSGRWSFSSGSDHCQWVILGTPVVDQDDKVVGQRNTLLRRGEYVVEDVWDTVGLRGTGSNDIVVEDVFVPEYRTLDLAQMFMTVSPGLEVNQAPLFRLSFATLFSYAITGAIIGMAEGMLAETLAYTRQRVSKVWGKALDDPYTIAAIGEAAREIAACRALLFQTLTAMYEKVSAGQAPTLEERAAARRDQVLASTRCVAAIDDIFDRSGAGAILSSNPMQRIWRDAHTGRHHTINSLERALFSYTNVALGLHPTDPMV